MADETPTMATAAGPPQKSSDSSAGGSEFETRVAGPAGVIPAGASLFGDASPSGNPLVDQTLREAAFDRRAELSDATFVLEAEQASPTDEAGHTVWDGRGAPPVDEDLGDQTVLTQVTSAPTAGEVGDQTQVVDSEQEIAGSQDTVDSSPDSGNAATIASRLDSFERALREGEPSLSIGDAVIGRFQIQKLLGEGAFGSVYLASDPQLDRQVAIKVSKVGVLTSRSDVNRFLREARAAAQLRHPHIVPVYEVGRIGGSSFIAYEYVPGNTLKGYLKERGRKLDPRDAARLIRTLAEALDYAHGHGIVHRDMKPDNVLMDAQGEPHIADFGLARRDDQATDKTREGAFMGTPLYMSPEQASGKGHLADGRSDVWSLGVMLREMLTGVLPFRGDLTQILIAVKTLDPPPLRSLDARLSKDLETICQKCLAKDPGQRYATAGELAAELDRYLRGEPILARPISVFARTGRWMKRNPAIAGLLAAIAAVLLLGTTVSTYFAIAAARQTALARKEQAARSLAQLGALQSAVPDAMPVLLETLRPARAEIAGRLIADLKSDEGAPLARHRLRLARVNLFPDAGDTGQWLPEIAATIPFLTADEIAATATVLAPVQRQTAPWVEALLAQPELDRDGRFRLLSTLAALAPERPEWQGNWSADVAAALLSAPSHELPAWMRLLQPVRESLRPQLTTQFRSDVPAVNEAAAAVLALLCQDDANQLANLAAGATGRQLRLLQPQLKSQGAALLEVWPAERTNTPGLESERLSPKAALFLTAAIARPTAMDWSCLEVGPDNTVRTEIIHRAAESGAPWEVFARRCERTEFISQQAAALQILSGYSISELLPADRERIAARVQELAGQSHSAAVRSSAVWLLEKWGFAVKPEAVPPADRDWDVDGRGVTFTIVRGPLEFRMGSPADDPLRSDVEHEHLRLLPRSFAIAQRETTVREFLQFEPNRRFNSESSPEETCPINDVSWLDAARYCRWLSEQAGVAEDQMCFPPLDQIRPGMTLPEDVLERTGYRLPTAAEWEFVCRAGAATPRPFGLETRWLEEYAWFDRNSRNRAWPTGQLKPNDLGLFDLHGNVMEWCLDFYFDELPPTGEQTAVVDGADRRDGIYREIRGGAFNSPEELQRTADRDYELPGNQSYVIGFRVARTLAPASP